MVSQNIVQHTLCVQQAISRPIKPLSKSKHYSNLSSCHDLYIIKARLAKTYTIAFCTHIQYSIVALLVSLILGTLSGTLGITTDEGRALGVMLKKLDGILEGIVDGIYLTTASFNKEKYVPSKSRDRNSSTNSILPSP